MENKTTPQLPNIEPDRKRFLFGGKWVWEVGRTVSGQILWSNGEDDDLFLPRLNRHTP